MLPCARGCIGKKLKHLPAVCAEPRPQEPLLFLYPGWFQEAARGRNRHERSISARKFSTGRTSCIAPPGVGNGETGQHCNSNTLKQKEELSTPDHARFEPLDRVVNASNASSTSSITWLHEPGRSFDRNFALRNRERKSQALEERRFQRERQRQRTAPYHSQRLNGLELAQRLSLVPPDSPANSDTIQLEAKFLQWLTGTSEENIWKHHDGSGCVVHVRSNVNHDRTHRKVVLTGTDRAKDITAQYLRNLQAQHHQNYDPALDTTPLGYQNTESSNYARVDQLPRPVVWNLRTFVEYVTLVTSARAPRAVERALYPGKESFKVAAAGILMDIFSDPQLYRYQSSLALRQALKFFSSKTDIANYARYVWTASRQAGVVPDITCFNLEISRFIAVGNELSIRRLLSDMKANHVQPDATTWRQFFKLLHSKEERNTFLRLSNNRYMHRDELAKESMVQAFVQTSFEPSDQEPNSVPMFQTKAQRMFGDVWLTAPVLQLMIEKCAAACAFQTLSKVVRLATNFNIQLDTDSFTALFKAVVKSGWFEDVQSLLQLMPERFDFHYRQVLIERAFREAWRQRLTNTARVLWHYAASHGSIRHTMLMKVVKELTNNAHGPGEHLASTMSAVIVGTDQSLFTAGVAQNSSEHQEAAWDLVASLKQWTQNGEARHNQMQRAHLLLERELTAWQRVEPMKHAMLLELMKEAFEKDLSWHRSKTLAQTPLREIMKQAIQIRLIPRKVPIRVLTLMPGGADTTSVEVDTAASPKESIEDHALILPRYIDSIAPSKEEDVQGHYQEETQLYATNFGYTTKFTSVHPCILPMTATATASISTPFIDLVLQYLGLAWDGS